MSDLKGEVLKEIELSLSGKFSREKLKDIISIINIGFNDFELKKIKYEVVNNYIQNNEQILKKFMISKKIEGLSDKSLLYYSLTIRKFLEIVSKDLTKVKTDDVRFYLAVEIQKGKNSDVSIDSKRRVLNSFYTWTTEEDITPANPVLRIKKFKITKTEKEPFSDLEIEKLRDSCKTQLEKVIFEILLSTGARRLELATALKCNYSSKNQELLILGKGKKERKVFLSTKAIYELDKYLATRTDDLPFLIAPIRLKSCKSIKEPINYSTINLILKKLAERAGVNDVHAHRFRRTAATIALKRGMPIEQVQRLLGHNQIDTTLIYAKIDQEDFKNNYKKIMS